MEKICDSKRTNWMGINDPNALTVLQRLQTGDIVEFRRRITIDESLEMGRKLYASNPLLPLLEGVRSFVNSTHLSRQELEFVVGFTLCYMLQLSFFMELSLII